MAHGNLEYWAHDNLPSKGERPMAGWLVVDTNLLTSTVAEAWQRRPVKVRIITGRVTRKYLTSHRQLCHQFIKFGAVIEIFLT